MSEPTNIAAHRSLIVVPARYGSTRLPGKPLLSIAGRTLLDRVTAVARAAAALAGNAEVLVATDDDRIAAHARELGLVVAMTPSAISSGSGRAFAAASGLRSHPDVVVNLQGDAPFIPPALVAALVTAQRGSQSDVTTPVVPLDWDALDAMRAHKQRTPFSGTTCIRADDGRALWFSKAIVPAIRDEEKLRAANPMSPVLRHLGLYAYRLDALARFEEARPSHYEALEGLEQLRFLELGMAIQTIKVDPPVYAMSGIDTPADMELAEQLIARHGDPYAVAV